MQAKLVHEDLNEKFTDESDPIKDLGIGEGTLHNLKRGDIIKVKYNCSIDKNKRLVFSFKLATYFKPTMDWIYKGLYLIVDKVEYKDDKVFIIGFNGSNNLVVAKDRKRVLFIEYPDFQPPIPKGDFWVFEKNIDKMLEFVKDNKIKESLNEKFQDISDPIKDMGIGYPQCLVGTKIYIPFGYELSVYNKLYKRSNSENENGKIWTINSAIREGEFIKVTLNNFTVFLTEKQLKLFSKKYQNLIKEDLNEKFTEESDPIHDLGIGYFEIVKKPRNVFYFIERGPNYVEGGKPTTYVYSMDKGNVYRTHPNLYAHQELRSNSNAFNKGNTDKMAIPNDFNKAYAFIMDHYIKKRKRARLRESLNEKFTETSDAIVDMGIGFNPQKTKTKSFKILLFINSRGEDGASLLEIQHFIYVELNGGSEQQFWETKEDRYWPGKKRITRGYWCTNLLGSHRWPGLLHKYCKKNEKGKWVIKRWPKFEENLYDFDKK
jgi:hypothetical protein